MNGMRDLLIFCFLSACYSPFNVIKYYDWPMMMYSNLFLFYRDASRFERIYRTSVSG